MAGDGTTRMKRPRSKEFNNFDRTMRDLISEGGPFKPFFWLEWGISQA